MTDEQRYVFFDLETTSVDTNTADIVQIAAIATGPSPNFVPIEEFEMKLRPSAQGLIDIGLAKQGGFNHVYTEEAWADAVSETVGLAEFGKFVQDYATMRNFSKYGMPYYTAQLVGHNAASYDAPILFRKAKSMHVTIKADYRVLDTLQLAMWFANITGNRLKSYKLADLAAILSVKVERAHDALSDVETTIGVARALLAKTKK